MTTPPPPPPQEPPIGGVPSGDGNLLRPQSDDDKTMGMVAHGLGLFIGFLGPLILMMAKKDSAFIQQESKEALNFQIMISIAAFVSSILIFVIIGCLLLPIILLVDLIFIIMAIMKVSNGEGYRYPINIRLIK